MAVLLKPTNLYLGIPVACLVLQRLGGRFWRFPIVWICAALSVGPTVLWWLHCYDFPIAFTPFWDFGPGEDKWGGSRVWLGDDFAYFWKHILFHYVMVPASGTLLFLGWLKLTRANAAALVGWTVGVVLFAFTISEGLLGHDYYRIPFIPLCSIWMGAGTDVLWSRRRTWSRLILRGGAVAIWVFVWRQSRPQIRGYYERGDPTDFRRLVEMTKRNTEPDDLIIWLSVWGHPELFYYADRRGWKIWEDFPDPPSSFLARARRNLYAVISASRPEDLERILRNSAPGQELIRFPMMERDGANAVFALRSNKLPPRTSGPFQWVGYGAVLSDPLTSAPSAFLWKDGYMQVIALGPNGKPWHAFHQPGMAWHSNGEILDERLYFDPVGFLQSDGYVQFLAVSPNFKLWHAYRDAQFRWDSRGEVMSPQGLLTAGVSGYATNDGLLHAFLLAKDERPGLSPGEGLLREVFRDATSNWSDVPLGRSILLSSAASGFLHPDGSTQVLARSPNGRLWHAFRDGRNNWHWVGEVLEDVLTSRPTGFIGPDGLIHVVALGTSGRLWHGHRDSQGAWHSNGEVLAEPLGSAPSAVVAPDGMVHVFAQTQDHRLWEAVMRSVK
ncbi:MAG: hypothetical protein HYT87_18900 [Nitrospirae bacterium]|nr:hypothetical protein [Nitrospirota bacterium]